MSKKLSTSEIEFIISRVLANAREAKKDDDKSSFAEGKKLAYYEILNTIKNELMVRNIDVKSVGLDFPLEEIL